METQVIGTHKHTENMWIKHC